MLPIRLPRRWHRLRRLLQRLRVMLRPLLMPTILRLLLLLHLHLLLLDRRRVRILIRVRVGIVRGERVGARYVDRVSRVVKHGRHAGRRGRVLVVEHGGLERRRGGDLHGNELSGCGWRWPVGRGRTR